MYKLVIFALAITVASAGLIGAPVVGPAVVHGAHVVAAPRVVAAPVAPVAYAAPVVVAAHPVAYGVHGVVHG